jgi:hypothetical protein
MVDHIIPAKETGPVFDPRLLRACCRPCNNYVAAHAEWRPVPASAEPRRRNYPYPAAWELDGSCPHTLPDGSSCIGKPGHHSRDWSNRDHEPEDEP